MVIVRSVAITTSFPTRRDVDNARRPGRDAAMFVASLGVIFVEADCAFVGVVIFCKAVAEVCSAVRSSETVVIGAEGVRRWHFVGF